MLDFTYKVNQKNESQYWDLFLVFIRTTSSTQQWIQHYKCLYHQSLGIGSLA